MTKPVNISSYEVGQVVGAVSARYKTGQTTPPERFDMATILDFMLDAKRMAKTDADRKILEQVGGLGTARTRQAIVEGLIRKGLIRVEKKSKRHVLVPTLIAEELRDKVPEMLASVGMTAKWEFAFKLVEDGKVEWVAVVDKAYEFVKHIVDVAKEQSGKFTKVEPAKTGKASGAGKMTGSGGRVATR